MPTLHIKKNNIHPLAKIIKKELIENPEFTFNHISICDYYWVKDCNLFFPQKNKYRYIEHQKTHFFWRDYCEWISFDKEYNNPEYIHSWYKLYIFDGTTKYWENNSHKYENNIPNDFSSPEDETPTDQARRHVHYIKNLCEWGLLECTCSYGHTCLQELNNFDYQSKLHVSLGTVNTLEERLDSYKQLL